jgi:predicted N-acetyltransferase YhbS
VGFWKDVFSGSETVASSRKAPISYTPYKTRVSASTTGHIYFSTDRDFNFYELVALWEAVGWSRRSLQKVKKAVQHSFLVVSIWQVQDQHRRLIGFARATSDHAFNATIWGVAVHPEVQGNGLGKALVRHTIDELYRHDITTIALFAEPHVTAFYQALGFVPDAGGATGMFWEPNEALRADHRE